MQSNGGFIIDDLSAVFAADAGQPAPPTPHAEDRPAPDAVATPKALTPKQEAKLRSYLDGALEDITRGYRKRFDPSSHLRTLTAYLDAWLRLLGVLAHVPPYGGGSTNLLVSYLLRCSTDICDGIAGYSLAMEIDAHRRQSKRQSRKEADHLEEEASGRSGSEDRDGEDSDDEEEERRLQALLCSKQLSLVLQTIDLLDRIWAAVLRGNLIDLPLALSNAKQAHPATPTDASVETTDRPTQAYDPRRIHSTSSLVPSPAVDGRFVSGASASSSSGPRESLPVHGGRGPKTVGVTDQVRLRNIAVSSRDKLFAWMRTEMDAPPPPIMEENEQEPDNNTIEGALGARQARHPDPNPDDDDEDPDMEDVAIDAQVDEEGYDVADDTEEHKHYQDLFERKLDPDADDDDDDEPTVGGGRPDSESNADATRTDQDLGASVLGMVEAVTTHAHQDKRKRDDTEDGAEASEARADGLPGKRPRAADSDTDEADAKMSRSELGSIHAALPEAIGRWDLAFTRLFSRTLRTLSDLGEAARPKASKRDFATTLTGISGADDNEIADDLA